MNEVTAVILAGGRGVDFGALSEQRTKAAFPVAGYYRIVDFALSNLSHSGIRSVGIIIQYLPAALMDHIGSGRAWDFDMADRTLRFMTPFVGYHETRWFHGTGDALAKNLNLLNLSKSRDVMVLSGEHVYSADYRPLIAAHRRNDADLTMAYVEMPPERQHPRFGNLVLDEAGRVTQFVEKPAEPVCARVFTGIYVFRREVLVDLLTRAAGEGGEFTLAGDILQPSVERLRTFAWKLPVPWHYLGDLREYHDFHMALAREPEMLFTDDWNVMTNFSDRMLGSRPSAFMASCSTVESSVISPGCHIEGAVINSVLSPGVHVARGASVEHSVVFHDAVIGPGAHVSHTIVDKDARLEEGCRIGAHEGDEPRPLTVIPKGFQVAAGRRVTAGERLECPVRL